MASHSDTPWPWASRDSPSWVAWHHLSAHSHFEMACSPVHNLSLLSFLLSAFLGSMRHWKFIEFTLLDFLSSGLKKQLFSFCANRLTRSCFGGGTLSVFDKWREITTMHWDQCCFRYSARASLFHPGWEKKTLLRYVLTPETPESPLDDSCDPAAQGLLWAAALDVGWPELEGTPRGPLTRASVSHVSLQIDHLRRTVILSFVCF